MILKQSINDLFADLQNRTRSAVGSDKQAIVELGMTMEGAAATLCLDEALSALFQNVLVELQDIYQSEQTDCTCALHAVADMLEFIRRQSCNKSGSQPAVPAIVPTGADDAVGMLIGADKNDRSIFQGVSEFLYTCACDESRSQEVRSQAKETANDLRAAVEANTPVEGRLLQQAMDCMEAIGNTIPAAAPAKPAAPVIVQAAAKSEPAVPDSLHLPEDSDMPLLKEYVMESLDHITAAESSMLALETKGQDTEEINTIFRAFHTIKGTSGFLGLDAIQRLAHFSENMLDRARSNQITLSGGYADLALKSCDLLRALIEGLGNCQAGGEVELPEDYASLMEVLKNPEAAGIGSDIAATSLRLGDILVARQQATREDVEAFAASQQGQLIGTMLVQNQIAKPAEVAQALRTQKQMQGTSDATIRVSTERLDHLVNMVGELVISHSMVAQDPVAARTSNPRLARNVSHVGKIVRELQDHTMSLRMVPLRPTFQKMARLVRDLARKGNKSVRFITEGEDTEIDRNMVEALNDPLVHMIRNAVDHGIEPEDNRLQANKNATGTIILQARHSAGNVVIELKDDGRGLDRNKIFAKAVQKGLVDADRDLTDQEVYGLIFLPGFSTAEKVTDVSGRGVGMDVVKRGIDTIRGRIELNTVLGQGSTFTLKLPLTMAITDAMLIRVGNSRYLVPTIAIERTFRPTAETVSTVVGKGEMVNVRGNLLPMFRLHNLFHVKHAQTEIDQALLIIIEGNGRKCALMIDELLGQQQVVVKSLGSSFGKIPGISGGAILGDGQVGLILDSGGLVELAQGQIQAA